MLNKRIEKSKEKTQKVNKYIYKYEINNLNKLCKKVEIYG